LRKPPVLLLFLFGDYFLTKAHLNTQAHAPPFRAESSPVRQENYDPKKPNHAPKQHWNEYSGCCLRRL
jgi:hypothetical protein